MSASLVGSEMCIRDSLNLRTRLAHARDDAPHGAVGAREDHEEDAQEARRSAAPANRLPHAHA
eukprot:5611436-Alexandrium_andersonii.AAC.1